MPRQAQAIVPLQKFLEPDFGVISGEEAGNLVFALAISTVFHEGVHGILGSTPTSQLSIDFERVSGRQNTSGEIVTLLDEDLTYAIQGHYAQMVEPVESLTSRISDQEYPVVKIRKALGEKLRPKIVKYMKAGKSIDDDFKAFASQAIKEAEDV